MNKKLPCGAAFLLGEVFKIHRTMAGGHYATPIQERINRSMLSNGDMWHNAQHP